MARYDVALIQLLHWNETVSLESGKVTRLDDPVIAGLYSCIVYFDTKKREASALGLTGSQEKAGSCPNKMLALYKVMLRVLRLLVSCLGLLYLLHWYTNRSNHLIRCLLKTPFLVICSLETSGNDLSTSPDIPLMPSIILITWSKFRVFCFASAASDPIILNHRHSSERHLCVTVILWSVVLLDLQPPVRATPCGNQEFARDVLEVAVWIHKYYLD
jgi:hypothetical protein